MLPYIIKHENTITPPALPKPTQKATIISFSIINVSHMKTYILLLAFITVCLVQCRKPSSSKRTDVPGLPPATQTGANTLGFLLNGQPWTPQGSNGTANLSIDFDPGFNKGIFSIVAYKFNTTTSEQFIIGIRDSLNYLNIPIVLRLSPISLYSISYKNSCDYWNQLPEVFSSGELSISKLDKSARIIAGTFNATLFRNNCDTIKITQGRFDMRF
jgi:hypothetical protein